MGEDEKRYCPGCGALIQDIDKKTGDVKPSKILNINNSSNYYYY
jgi:hypothetical protein